MIERSKKWLKIPQQATVIATERYVNARKPKRLLVTSLSVIRMMVGLWT